MSIRKVALGSTFRMTFNTTRFSTGEPFTLAGSPSLSVYVDDNLTQITSGVSFDDDYDAKTGFNEATIIATTGNNYAAGDLCTLVVEAGTVDSVSAVGKILGEFQIETATELAEREFAEAMYPGHVLGTQTGVSDGTQINLVGIVNATDTASQLVGEVLAVRDSTLQIILVRVTAYALTNQLATVETIYNAGVMPFTAASGDMVWRVGQFTAGNLIGGAALATGAQASLAQADLDLLTGTDGATLATAQGNYAPAVAGDNMGTVSSVTGNVDGSTASVVGAVGSVTGSVGSVTGHTNQTADHTAALATLTGGVIEGAAATGTLSVTQCTSDLTGYVNDELIGRTITFISGTADGQQGRITDYASASGLITFTTITTAPANADTFKIT